MIFEWNANQYAAFFSMWNVQKSFTVLLRFFGDVHRLFSSLSVYLYPFQVTFQNKQIENQNQIVDFFIVCIHCFTIMLFLLLATVYFSCFRHFRTKSVQFHSLFNVLCQWHAQNWNERTDMGRLWWAGESARALHKNGIGKCYKEDGVTGEV